MIWSWSPSPTPPNALVPTCAGGQGFFMFELVSRRRRDPVPSVDDQRIITFQAER